MHYSTNNFVKRSYSKIVIPSLSFRDATALLTWNSEWPRSRFLSSQGQNQVRIVYPDLNYPDWCMKLFDSLNNVFLNISNIRIPGNPDSLNPDLDSGRKLQIELLVSSSKSCGKLKRFRPTPNNLLQNGEKGLWRRTRNSFSSSPQTCKIFAIVLKFRMPRWLERNFCTLRKSRSWDHFP